jgi:hypothetical protein
VAGLIFIRLLCLIVSLRCQKSHHFKKRATAAENEVAKLQASAAALQAQQRQRHRQTPAVSFEEITALQDKVQKLSAALAEERAQRLAAKQALEDSEAREQRSVRENVEQAQRDARANLILREKQWNEALRAREAKVWRQRGRGG